jgi:hypothetical protein
MRPFTEVLGVFLTGGTIGLLSVALVTNDPRIAVVAFVGCGLALDKGLQYLRNKDS